MSRMPGMRWDRAQPVTRWLREQGLRTPASLVLASQQGIARRLLRWFEGTDLWLTPTSVHLPPRVGAYRKLQQRDPGAAFLKIAELGAFTAICNVTGQPAISLPAGRSRSGLPIGAHLAGPPEGEALLLQVARQLEEAGLRGAGIPAGFGA
jgi:amidase